MKEADIKMLADAFGPVIREFVAREVRPLAKGLKELQARAVIFDAGVWQPGQTYGKHKKSLLSACHCGAHREFNCFARISHLSRVRNFRSRYVRQDRWTREQAYLSQSPCWMML